MQNVRTWKCERLYEGANNKLAETNAYRMALHVALQVTTSRMWNTKAFHGQEWCVPQWVGWFRASEKGRAARRACPHHVPLPVPGMPTTEVGGFTI